MNYETTNHPLWPHDTEGEECQNCGSNETYMTFDGKLVCRYCCHVETITPRPVNVITHKLRLEYANDINPAKKYDMQPIHDVMHEAIENLNKLKS